MSCSRKLICVFVFIVEDSLTAIKFVVYIVLCNKVFCFIKTVEDSPWTEKTKFEVNSTYMIDPDVVHPLLQNRSVDLQKTIPHDHAMLFTK